MRIDDHGGKNLTQTEIMGVSEAAAFLDIKKPNLRKYLERRGIVPYATLALGPVWDRETLQRVREERESDPEKVAADQRRRAGALGTAEHAGVVRLGESQRQVLNALSVTSQSLSELEEVTTGSGAGAIKRLLARGFITESDGVYTLSDLGRDVVG